jgi:hypothetical protein
MKSLRSIGKKYSKGKELACWLVDLLVEDKIMVNKKWEKFIIELLKLEKKIPKPIFINNYKERIVERKCDECRKIYHLAEPHCIDYPTYCSECASKKEI